MPELPEVETIRRDLAPRLTGRWVVGVALPDPKLIRHPSPQEFQKGLQGRVIEGLERRGKYLIFRLARDGALVLHLKMTGALLYEPQEAFRLSLSLDDGTSLYFSDRRRMGVAWLVADAGEVVGGLGPEPLEEAFTPQALLEKLKGRSAPIKALLTDQSFLAGVGNMYADEALFAARLHPLRPGKSLAPPEVERLHGALQEALLRGLEAKGASIATYRRPDGTPGRSQLLFKVAHRAGQPCPSCGMPVARLKLRGRGTCFCPRCQPLAGEPLS